MFVVVAGMSGVGLAIGGATPSSAATTATSVVTVNSGGPSASGWSGDSAAAPSRYLSAGQAGEVAATTAPINVSDPSVPAGTPQSVFQTERWTAGPAVGYDIPATVGQDTVRLYFAENYAPAEAVGARLMDVSINGTIVEHNLDVYKLVGASKGLVRSYTVQSSGTVAIRITNPTHSNSPHVMGVEVDPPAAPATVMVDSGGAVSAAWSADSASSPSAYLSGGQPAEVATTSHAIDVSDASVPSGTGQAVFQTERWTAGAALGYSVPAPVGSVQVQLYFAENYAPAEAVGARLMDVSINGVNVEHNLDVFKQVGAFKGLVRTYTVQSSGAIAVSLTNPLHTNSPHLMALEVGPLVHVGQPPTTQPPTTQPPTTQPPTTQPPTTQPPTTQPPTTQPPVSQPPASAITLSPGADVAAAVAAAPAGSAFYLKDGTYSVGAIAAQDRRFDHRAEPGRDHP